jgi:CheY-like chemotaxis protein
MVGTVLRDLRILVVEDVPALRQLICRMIEGLGCESIAAAGTLAEAWALLNAQKFDALLLDYQLAGEVGLKLVTRLRADCIALNHDLSVVVLTGQADAARVCACQAAGADAIMIKPVRPDVLGARIIAAITPRLDTSRHGGRAYASS